MELIFSEGIYRLSQELFEGKLKPAIKLVHSSLKKFIKVCQESGSPKIYSPPKFFSEWMNKDFNVLALRKKKAAEKDETQAEPASERSTFNLDDLDDLDDEPELGS